MIHQLQEDGGVGPTCQSGSPFQPRRERQLPVRATTPQAWRPSSSSPSYSAEGSEADAAAAAPKHGRRGLGRLLADRIARGVQELYDAEVRRVAPRVMWEGMSALTGGHGCVEEANELIEGFNAGLAARLDVLRPQLPGANVVFCDVYKGMMEIISNPTKYGFEETREACCGLGPFKATVGCLSSSSSKEISMACAAPERHVWWDLYTPTEAVTADCSWSTPMSICSPLSLQQLVT